MNKLTTLPTTAILFENKEVIILNKPATFPSVEDKSGDISILRLAEHYYNQSLFPVNRLDRPVSGIVILARNPSAAAQFNAVMQQGKIRKFYLAATEHAPPEVEGSIEGWISVDKRNNKSHFLQEEKKNALKAISRYRLLESSDNYTLLGLELMTGRQHQLRAQLSFLNCPVKGDVKYGARRKNKDRSIHLHAFAVEFTLPGTEEIIRIVAPLPEDNLWMAFEGSSRNWIINTI